jgi:hypothetical protein
MDNQLIEWLLNNEPWTEYRTRIDLIKQNSDEKEVGNVREKMLNHPNVISLISELSDWDKNIVNSHKNAALLYHKLTFLTDIGLNQCDKGITPVIEKIFEHISDEGPFQVPMNIPVHFGGTGNDQFAWALCDAPLLIYCLSELGLSDNENVIKAKNYLVGLQRENGFPCVVSKELGKFRGPGRKNDPCPYSTLIMLKLMSCFDDEKNSEQSKIAIESLLKMWEQSKTIHPYMFYMGKDFRKLKAPLIWYDIVNLADTLSHFKYAVKDYRFDEIMQTINSKADNEGKFTPESEWKAWKGWDFGQKKHPSSWLTFLIYRIKERVNK